MRMRLMSPSLAEQFPRRTPAGMPPTRVANPKTEAEWAPYVGEQVMVETKDTNNTRPVPAKLLALKRGGAQVLLPNHGHPIIVELKCIRRWVKGEEQGRIHQEAHAKREESRAIAFPVTPAPAPVLPELKGRAAYISTRAAKSIVPGKALMRDTITGKYWVGGRPGTLFEASKHAFVGTVERALLTSTGALDQCKYQFERRGIRANPEYLTVEEAWLRYQDRHPSLDAYEAEVKARQEAKERAEAEAHQAANARAVEPEPATAPAPVAVAPVAAVEPEPVVTTAIALVPAPQLPAVVHDNLPVHITPIQAAYAKWSIATKEKAAADALALNAAGTLLEAEAAIMIELKRKELGL